MAKVDWITWKTNPKEIINPSKIIEEIDEKYTDYNCYMNSVVYEGIKYEMLKGGLSKEAFNILGISPANDSARKVLDIIENIKVTIEKLKSNVYNLAIEQKKIEKEQLISAIETKIIEEEKALNNIIRLKEKINESNNIISYKELQDIIDITNERIIKLKEKLETANSI